MCQKYKQIRLQISLCFIIFKIFYLHFYLFKMTCCHCYNNIQTKYTVAPLSYEISHRKWYKRSFLKSKDLFFVFVRFHIKDFSYIYYHQFLNLGLSQNTILDMSLHKRYFSKISILNIKIRMMTNRSNIICLRITFISDNMISIIIVYCSLNYFSKANEAYLIKFTGMNGSILKVRNLPCHDMTLNFCCSFSLEN